MAYIKTNIIPNIYQALQIDAASKKKVNQLGLKTDKAFVIQTAYSLGKFEEKQRINVRKLTEIESTKNKKIGELENTINFLVQKQPIIIKRAEEKDYTELSGPTALAKYFGNQIRLKKITYQEFKDAAGITGTMEFNALTGIPVKPQIIKLLISFGAIKREKIHNAIVDTWLNDGRLLNLRIGNTYYQMKAFESKRILDEYNKSKF